jgi:hypothetical protein
MTLIGLGGANLRTPEVGKGLIYYDGLKWKVQEGLGIEQDLIYAAPAAASDYSCRALRATAQSIPYSAWTAISLDTENEDSSNFFTPISKVITIPAGLGGIYLCIGWVNFTITTGGIRAVAITLNNSSDDNNGIIEYSADAANGSVDSCNVVTTIRLVAGDTITLKVLQTRTAGTALDTLVTSLGRKFGNSLELIRLRA